MQIWFPSPAHSICMGHGQAEDHQTHAAHSMPKLPLKGAPLQISSVISANCNLQHSAFFNQSPSAAVQQKPQHGHSQALHLSCRVGQATRQLFRGLDFHATGLPNALQATFAIRGLMADFPGQEFQPFSHWRALRTCFCTDVEPSRACMQWQHFICAQFVAHDRITTRSTRATKSV